MLRLIDSQTLELNDFARTTRYAPLALTAHDPASSPDDSLVLIHDLPTLVRGREHISLPDLLASMGRPVAILAPSSDTSRVLGLGSNGDGAFELTELSFPPVTEKRLLTTLRRIRGEHTLRLISLSSELADDWR